jgi:CMP-N,N'-diacetyllegionaminic acid synthase
MNILITICGRAGSKGVKNKNIREFYGNKLIKYTIASAYLFKEKNNTQHEVDICVNSDSEDFLNIVSKYDLECIRRPSELAQDSSPKVPVIKYSLEYMEKIKNRKYEYIIDLDITSPFRKLEDIQQALNKAIENSSCDVVFSVVPSRRNPYFNMVEKHHGLLKKVINACYTARQQAPAVYDMNASIYCYKRNALLNILKKSPFDGIFDIILMKDTAVLDIDSEEDFELMQILASYFFKEEFKQLLDKTCSI